MKAIAALITVLGLVGPLRAQDAKVKSFARQGSAWSRR